MDVSSVSLSIVRPDRVTPCPYLYRQGARVIKDGKVLLEGVILDPTISAETWDIEIVDYWHNLDDTPYLGAKPKQINTTPGRPSLDEMRLTTKVIIVGNGAIPEQTGVTMTMREVLAAAQSVNIFPCDLAIKVEASDMVPFVTTAATYASILRGIHTWVPNAVSFFDYCPIDEAMRSGDPTAIEAARPVFRIVDPADMPVIDLPITQVDTTDFSIRARHDLVPPLVAVIGTDADSLFGQVLVNSIVPAGGNLQQPGNVIVQLDAGTLPTPESLMPDPDDPEDDGKPKPAKRRSYNVPRMLVRGAMLPRDNAESVAFWARHVPELSKIPNLSFTSPFKSITPLGDTPSKAYDPAATAYELVEGQISPKCKTIRWCKIEFSQEIIYGGIGCPDKYAMYFPLTKPDGRRYGIHTISEMVTTSQRLRSYAVGGDYEETDPEVEPPTDPEEPNPPGEITPMQSQRYDAAVASYYAATRIVPYDGRISLRGRRDDLGVGVRVNVLGDAPELEHMAAIVQTMEVDLATEAATLTIGPPKHMEIDKAAQKTNNLQQQYNTTKQETQDAPNGDRTASWDHQFEDKEDKDDPESPTIVPGGKYVPPSAAPPANGDFLCRAIVGVAGVISYQVHRGFFRSPVTGVEHVCGDTEWTGFSGEVWANLFVDNFGTPIRSSFTNSRAAGNPWHPKMTDDGKFDANATQPGTYSYRIASIVGDQIVQHISGAIPIVYRSDTFMW